MSTYFSDASFRFLRSLARHNDKAWFNDHRQQYEDHVRQPFLRLLGDLQPALAEVSEHFRADTRGVGGSLFRIHRDARFSNDKSPYKTWQGARLFHEREAGNAAPRAPLHPRQPGQLEGRRACPGPAQALRFRGEREAGASAAWFPRRLRVHRRPQAPQLGDVALAGRRHHDRPAPAVHAGQDLAALGPFVDYLCAALDLEF